MERTDLVLHPNEASDLSPVLDAATLAALGWDRAFVTVLDEVPGDECLVVLGHDDEADGVAAGWEAVRLPVRAGKGARKTQDAEAIARKDGLLYVLGSQFGKKQGPLQANRAWIARISEEEIAAWLLDRDGDPPRLQVARLRFALHRAANDALAAAAVDVVEPGPLAARRYVDATLRRGLQRGKAWADRLRAGDRPINVEGAGFRADGTLLVGLRYPTTRDGAPLLVQLDDVDAVLGGAEPRCSRVWWLDGVGTPDVPVGIRAMHDVGPDRFEAVVGNLDATGKGSTLVEEDARNGAATSAHVAFELPVLAGGGAVAARVVHRFAEQTRVEGIATHGDHLHYVIDEDGTLGLSSLLASDATPELPG